MAWTPEARALASEKAKARGFGSKEPTPPAEVEIAVPGPDEPMPIADIREWHARFVGSVDGFADAEIVRRVRAFRRRGGMPGFYPVQPRWPHRPLPAPSVGDR